MNNETITYGRFQGHEWRTMTAKYLLRLCEFQPDSVLGVKAAAELKRRGYMDQAYTFTKQTV